MKYLTIEYQGDVAVIGLNRPEKRNAISDAFIEELDTAITEAEKNAKAGVIHGNGPHFCAGLDLAEHVKKTPMEGVHGSWSVAGWNSLLQRMCELQTRLPSLVCRKASAAFLWAAGLRFALPD